MQSLIVEDAWSGCPLDELLTAHWPRVSKGRMRELVRAGLITVDGRPAQPGDALRAGQVVILDEDPAAHERAAVAPLKVEVLHEDEHLLAIAKPAGLPVEPSRWGEHPVHLAGAIVSWAQARAGDGPLQKRPRVLHRLDLGTSGVLLFALTLEAERFYRGLFAAAAVEKTYRALVIGVPEGPGAVDAPLAPDPRHEGRMRVDGSGKESLTTYTPQESFRGHCWVEARPRTGRTHQIRVHLAHVGHPLAVDPFYGGAESLYLSHFKRGYRPKPGRPEPPLLDRLSLHAAEVRIPNFTGGEDLSIVAPLPDDLERTLRQLRRWSPPSSPPRSRARLP
jgi:23S rRNA pseudouridine1911/1915/1917 synthase